MDLFDILAVLVSLSAVLSWLNYRFLRLPTAIGLMFSALVLSIAILVLGPLSGDLEVQVRLMLQNIDFNETLLHGMLSFLLFAGALHINLDDLAQQRWTIAILATASVIGATLLIGVGSWWLFDLIGLHLPFMACLLFGALIAPTDPIAVLGVLKSAGAPKTLETKIAGESLFNDGVAVVVFLVLLQLPAGGADLAIVADALKLFVMEAAGGVLYGLLLGALAYWMLKQVDDYTVEVLITLAVTTAGYDLAEIMHISAPIAIVVAGLLIGNHGRAFAMSNRTREHLDTFWELVDEILNAILFLLIGLEVLVLSLREEYLLAGVVAVPLVLLARLISVGLPIGVMRHFRSFSSGTVTILTWGGLRGGISIAMALSLPASEQRSALVTVTYVVVAFAMLVQGLTLGSVVSRLANRADVELARTRLDPDE